MNPQAKPEGLRQAMAWAHTWAGLLLGWVMFAIFLTGTLSFFRHEITLWMKPELQRLAPADAGTLARVEARLRELAPDAASWSIGLPDARQPGVRVFWREPAKDGKPGRFQGRLLDPATALVVEPRKSFGGDFFYRFHFELRSAEKSRWILEGRWAVGVATMAMFVALLSGIVTHRRILADFFTFRPGKGGQRAWLDAHNVSGVLVLPFYLLITFSGLMMFHTLYLPAGIAAAYGPERNDYFRESQGGLPAPKGLAPATAMPALPLADALAQARAHWPDGRIEGLSVLRHGGGVLRIEVRRDDGVRLQYPGGSLVFDAADPQRANRLHLADNTRPAAQAHGVLYGLHMARFADWGLRWLLFGFGLLGSVMIATGLVLWSVKRRARRGRSAAARPVGERLVEALNIGAMAGLPLAIAAYLVANRLLPVAQPERSDAELHAYFAAWGLALLWAVVWPARRTWQLQFALGALGFAALPLLSVLAAGQPGLPALLGQAWQGGSATVALVELAWLAAAALLGGLAWALRPARARALPAPVAAATDGVAAVTPALPTPRPGGVH
jgi:uncharacterized iron-regulated membrane protein